MPSHNRGSTSRIATEAASRNTAPPLHTPGDKGTKIIQGGEIVSVGEPRNATTRARTRPDTKG